jgi:hypothetical protein
LVFSDDSIFRSLVRCTVPDILENFVEVVPLGEDTPKSLRVSLRSSIALAMVRTLAN